MAEIEPWILQRCDLMKISSQADITRGVKHLCKCDDVLAALKPECGKVPLRLSEPGFSGLASIIVSQQVSKASAEAIFSRLCTLINPLTAEGFLNAGEDCWRQAGLSRPKQRTLRALSETVQEGKIDLDGLCEVSPDEALAALVEIKGIGPWTAEVYLMFCAGHRDIFPAGDLALQEAIRLVYGMDERPDEKTCRALAENWTPWRAVAARLLWRYYAVVKRDASPV